MPPAEWSTLVSRNIVRLARLSRSRRWFTAGLAAAAVIAAAMSALACTPLSPTSSGSPRGDQRADRDGRPTPTATATPSASASVSPSASASPSATTPKATSSTTGTSSSTGTSAACGSTRNVPGGRDPAGGCWPGPNNTGVPAGTTLTAVNHDMTVSTAGAVIDRMDIHGCVTVNAPGVRITRSRIHGSCAGDVVGHFVPAHDGNPYPANAAPLTITDSEISCDNGPGNGVGDTNIVLTRVNIWGCENGGDVDGHFTVIDSYIHNLWANSVSHTDGFQITEVGHAITFTHDSIDPLTDATSAIISSPASRDVLVQSNLLGGGAYSLYCAQGVGTSYRAIDNVFVRDAAYGPWTNCSGDATSGNVWADTGKPIS